MNKKNKETVIVFSPHPDDETLGCGGTIIKLLREGYRIKVVIMTDGSHSHSTVLKINNDPSPGELAIIRKQEVLNATKVLGLSSNDITFLDFEDGSLQVNIDNASKLITDYLDQQNDIMRIYTTHEKDSHRDHKATGIIVNNVVTTIKLKVPLFSYVIWPGENLDSTNLFVEEISDVLETKRKAINEYKSQIEIFSSQQARPVLLPEFVNKFKDKKSEEFWVTS
jgi:LmbE family N-acetylglucosaminyl deacetylase